MHAPNFIAELINLGVGNYKQTNKLWKTKPLGLYLLGMKPRTTGAGLGLASSIPGIYQKATTNSYSAVW